MGDIKRTKIEILEIKTRESDMKIIGDGINNNNKDK